MVLIIHKWLLLFALLVCTVHKNTHPYFVSVTEIEHNATDKSIEISCKIFTDDFEKTLRSTYHTKIDLLHPNNKAAMEIIVHDYIKNHVQIIVNEKRLQLEFLGYEQQQESIASFYQVTNIAAVKKIDITNTILYSYSPMQINIVHAIVGGQRQSTKLTNPEKTTAFLF
jgi:hypothetical protein